VGCSRYPDCDYIQRDGPPPPDQLAFEVTCPKNGDGHLVARRARRTGNVFWGCSAYPKCDFTTNHEPLGAVHDTDDGLVARLDPGAICLRCGASIELPVDANSLVGLRLRGGPPNPEALVPKRRGRPGGGRGGARRGSGAGAAGRGGAAKAGRVGGGRRTSGRGRSNGSAPAA
jgi:hypothetical protein